MSAAAHGSDAPGAGDAPASTGGPSADLLAAVRALKLRAEDLRSATTEAGQHLTATQLDDACQAISKAIGRWNHAR